MGVRDDVMTGNHYKVQKDYCATKNAKSDISEWNGKGVHLDEIAKKTKPLQKPTPSPKI